MIRLRFSTTRSFVPSALIRWRTQCAQSHVEFYDTNCGVTLGARWSFNHWDNGVRMRGCASTVDQVNVVEAAFDGIELAYEWGKKLCGTRYNLRGIFGIVAAKDWTDSNRMDCSNFIVAAAKLAGVELLSTTVIAPWKITPRDLLLSPLLTLVKEGK